MKVRKHTRRVGNKVVKVKGHTRTHNPLPGVKTIMPWKKYEAKIAMKAWDNRKNSELYKHLKRTSKRKSRGPNMGTPLRGTR